MILSDELIWAYSTDVGGDFDPSLFSIQFPQRIVQRTAKQLIAEGSKFSNHSFVLKKLPKSGTSLIKLFEMVAEEETREEINNSSLVPPLNTLLRVLMKVPKEDLQALQYGVQNVANVYSFYSVNTSMVEIPTAIHTYPSGGAIKQLERALAARKRKGIQTIKILCLREKSIKHAYTGNYPCDVFK